MIENREIRVRGLPRMKNLGPFRHFVRQHQFDPAVTEFVDIAEQDPYLDGIRSWPMLEFHLRGVGANEKILKQAKHLWDRFPKSPYLVDTSNTE